MIVPDMSTAPTVVVLREGPGPGSGSPTPGTDVAGRGPERGPGGSARRRRMSNFRRIISNNLSVQVFYAPDANSNIGTKFCRFKLTRFHFQIFVSLLFQNPCK